MLLRKYVKHGGVYGDLLSDAIWSVQCNLFHSVSQDIFNRASLLMKAFCQERLWKKAQNVRGFVMRRDMSMQIPNGGRE